ncbi:MAG: hypothetical protein N4A72_12705 [Bacteroidales bacterium]|jgi:transketolase|nr:hypothetical protein [Bacteroidales bacterium]
MRKVFSEYIEHISKERDDIVFLTGDLGFNALENVRDCLKERFINCGVAEQNMIGVAAGLASKGFQVFCYSIAPFVTFRVLEQIKVDICLNNLPVCIVGNGGGYGYGIMGATHHALEDIACMSSMPNMSSYIPATNNNVKESLDLFFSCKSPSYLRLGYSEICDEKVTVGLSAISKVNNPKMTILTLGPILCNVYDFINEGNEIDIYSVTGLPFKLSDEFINSIETTGKLLVVEEHVSRGGLGEYIAKLLLEKGVKLDVFKSLTASGYPNKLYGSQKYHQMISGIDSCSINNIIKEWC